MSVVGAQFQSRGCLFQMRRPKVSFEGREASYKYDQNGQIVSPLTALVNDLMARKVDPGDLGSTDQEPTKQLGQFQMHF